MRLKWRIYDLFDIDIATTLHNLAALYLLQGKPEKARPLLDRTVDIYEKTFGKEHPRYIEHVGNIALFYEMHNFYDQAIQFYELLLHGMNDTKVESEENRKNVMKRLSALYYKQQRFEDAKRLLENLLSLEEKAYGAAHLSTVTTMQNLAVLYQDDGQYEEAKGLYDRILSIWEKAGSAEKLNLDFATAFYNLAAFYIDLEQYEQARSCYSRTISIRSKILGPENPETQSAIGGYAVVERAIKQKRYAEIVRRTVRRKKH